MNRTEAYDHIVQRIEDKHTELKRCVPPDGPFGPTIVALVHELADQRAALDDLTSRLEEARK